MTHEIRRTIATTWPADQVFDYLLDFTNAEEWDYGTVTCTLISGDFGVGTTYRNVSRFLGRETTLVYEVDEVTPGERFVITGRNKTVTSRDTIAVSSDAGTSQVLYVSEMAFNGPSRLVSPLLALPLKQLGDNAAEQLRRVLAAKSVGA